MRHFETFGKYRIERKLSRSMTDVYLAHDTEANRPVVLKLIEQLPDEYTQTIIEAERRGALLQKQLHALDRRILEIYEFGDQNGCFFVAMEYFRGKTLAELLQIDKRFEPRRAVRYATEICSQLRTLHSFVSDFNGHKTAIVHGDVKPSNVQISPQDELRLLDFGIAKVITSTHNLTHHTLGSPSYCSPERISKSQVDQYADLWALGISLYEMLAGMPPYQAQDTRRLENLILSKRPPRALPENCPRALKAIVAKSLAADIGRRYNSAQAFESDLHAFLKGQPTAAAADREPAWDANATVVKGLARAVGIPTKPAATKPPAVAPVSKKRRRWNEWSNVAIALLAGILAGVLILIPASYCYRFWTSAAKLRLTKDYAHQTPEVINADWTVYQQLRTSGGVLRHLVPVADLDTVMQDHLVSAADNILDQYRGSTDAQLRDFDWAKAKLCLQKALEIDADNTKAKSKLALVTGYTILARSTSPASGNASLKSFKTAASYMPHSPDPHIGMARVYVSCFHNIGQALGELHLAEQFGYKLGPREMEQEADGYLFRGEAELTKAKHSTTDRAKWLTMARNDMDRARELYAPIAGFANVSSALEQLQEDQQTQVQLETASLHLTTPKKHWKVYR
ncbi:MAG TPA: serine/threonine-protein kinase [Bryobacteraceae bacterium]|nr:serine/threonine-protein kinase [Bryobacteraceae bacterium]